MANKRAWLICSNRQGALLALGRRALELLGEAVPELPRGQLYIVEIHLPNKESHQQVSLDRLQQVKKTLSRENDARCKPLNPALLPSTTMAKNVSRQLNLNNCLLYLSQI